jgi:hypothetical protein
MADPTDPQAMQYFNLGQLGGAKSDPPVPRWQQTVGTVHTAHYPWGGGPLPAIGSSTWTTKDVPSTQYVQEFYDKWDDQNFQTWFMSRAIAAGVKSDANYSDYLNVWIGMGEAVAKGHFAGTPEQYLEWIATGQQTSAEDIREAIENGTPLIDPVTGEPILPGSPGSGKANPITTHRSTSSATISREAAYAVADQLGQKLLGRMMTKAEMKRARGVMNGLLRANPTVTTSTTDATDPNNVVSTSHTQQGMSATEAADALEMKIQRSSEGTAYTVGNMFEDAMRLLAQKEG